MNNSELASYRWEIAQRVQDNQNTLIKPRIEYPVDTNPVFMRGEIDPYWGSGTVEKKTNPLIKISGTDRALDAAKRLSRVKMWVIDEKSEVGNFLVP